MKGSHFRKWIAVVLLMAFPTACRRGSMVPLVERNGIEVQSAYAHPSAGDAGAAYFRIVNAGNGTDTLMGLTGSGIGTAMVMGTNAGRMTTLGALILTRGENVTMAPGGVHVMFGGLTNDWAIGDTVHLTLRFARAGDMEVAVPVLPFGEIP